ncbi:MAG: hypothetical protein IPM11_00730 [Micropruina sp.]|nr:hypothetical protein [Micropruina sp.]
MTSSRLELIGIVLTGLGLVGVSVAAFLAFGVAWGLGALGVFVFASGIATIKAAAMTDKPKEVKK